LAIAGAIFTLGAGWLPLAGSSTALAAPAELWTRCDKAAPDIQCNIPRGIAANSGNGHVYVVDSANHRVDEFNALGQSIRAWGWDVVEGGAAGFEICTPMTGDKCQTGASGSGVGQFNAPQGVALDGAGDVYVADWFNLRVEKFDSEGHFLLMFGDEVDKGPIHPGDICTAQFVAEGDNCGAGKEGGAGEGQFSWPASGSFIAIDPTDKVYVGDRERIQLFDTSGVYQSECSLPAGVTVKGLAVDASGELYATYDKPDVRKLKFVAGGACEEQAVFKLPKLGSSGNGEEAIPTAVAVDGAGNVYAAGPMCQFCSEGAPRNDPIVEFDSAGNEIDHWGVEEFSNSGPTGLATNFCFGSAAPGNLYVTNPASGTGPPKSKEAFVRAYGTNPVGCFKARTLPASNVAEEAATLNGTVNPSGSAVSECRFEYGTSAAYGEEAACLPTSLGEGSEPVPVHADLNGLGKGTVYHYRLVAKVGGETETGADEEFKTLGPPVISAEHVVGATDTEVTLKALVNPEGFATSYHFEYGTTALYGQRTVEIAVGKDRSDHAVVAGLNGLAPGTTYHWRVVAVNSSGPSEGEDRTLTTYRVAQGAAPCANDAFRTTASATLPDCRAYEMVSPVDKNGADVVLPSEESGVVQSNPGGDKLTYTATAAFAGAPAAFAVNQYMASRGAAGWASEGIHPPMRGETTGALVGLTRDFMAFTPDLCSAWLVDFQTPPVVPDGQLERQNLYRRENCGAGAGNLEALTPSPPLVPESAPDTFVGNTSVQGISDDGRHAVFVAGVALPQVPEASPALNEEGRPIEQLYDRSGGRLSLVSVLPDKAGGDPTPGDGRGFADAKSSVVGSGWVRNLRHAVSIDGSRVYWTGGIDNNGNGTIYLRRHPQQGIVAGECSEAAVACTTRISGSLEAFFWGASADGRKALYSEANLVSGKTDLLKFEEGGGTTKVGKDVLGVVETSEDLSHVYFVSRSKQGPQKNIRGEEASEGAPNLYLDDEGTLSFIGTLTEGDLGALDPGAAFSAYSLASSIPRRRAVRLSANGERLAFESRAPLTGFDNTARDSGAAAVEVYLYDAGSTELHCVSCNPSGASPIAGELKPPYEINDPRPTKVMAAAWIPTWEQSLYPSNVLSADGGRLFFNSNDALLPRDTNGAQDVYEWEEAGVGDCSEEDPSYFPANGGCLALISSGENPSNSEFWEASPSGDDVFFTTGASLLPQDPGLLDLYDARVGGGFAQPTPRTECEGEACQSPPPAPEFPTPSSARTEGVGNVPPSSGCPRGKHRVRKGGKSRCVPKGHNKQKRRHAKHKRRAAR